MTDAKTAEDYMALALEEAKKAEALGEVPIGAVAVYQSQVVGRGYNLREMTQDATSHAEMIAIRQANRALSSWRLNDVDLYVTLEPCSMCAGAIVLSRIRHLYYGASDNKAGAVGTLMNLVQDDRLNHQAQVTAGVRGKECSQMLTDFFRRLRQDRKGQSRKPKLRD